MTTKILLCAVLAVPFLCAQDDKGKPQMPNPKTKAHEALAMLAGHWQNTCKMAAMPGVPGMEKPSEWTGSEHAELVCNGLWLKASIDARCQDKTMRGLWLAGYDPLKKKYTGIWVSSDDEPSSTSEGTYDEATRTWSFAGSSPMGEFRSSYVLKDADNSVETCYLKTADGKETECMQIVRTRVKGAVAKDAGIKVSDIAGKQPATLAKEYSLLTEGIGKWDAVVTMAMPGQPASEEKATEHVVSTCDGKWTWSDFRGTMMGAPFEGHALVGYEPATKQYVSYWIDSMSPQVMKTTGAYDAAKKAFTFTGSCVDENGKPMTVHETFSVQDKDNRLLEMTFKGDSGSQQMKIAYKRAGG